MKRKGAISNTGYKSNSKDRFNDFNLIPSNRITMKGVDNPLLMIPMGDRGVGNPVMGTPGEEYFFPNYDMVMEMRLPKGASHMNYQRLQNGGSSYLPNWVQWTNRPDFMQPSDPRIPIGYENYVTTIPSNEIATSIGGKNGEPAYLIPSFKYGKPLRDPVDEFRRTGDHLGGPFKTWQDAERFGELRHQYLEKGQDVPYPLLNFEYKRGGQKKGSKKFTNKNIQSSVNKLMRRNETLYGPSGKKYFDPLAKFQKAGQNPYPSIPFVNDYYEGDIPEVTLPDQVITAEAPYFAKQRDKYYQQYPKEWYFDKKLPKFSRNVGVDRSGKNWSSQTNAEYDKFIMDKVAEDLLKRGKNRKQTPEGRLAWYNSYTPKEREIIQQSSLASRFNPAVRQYNIDQSNRAQNDGYYGLTALTDADKMKQAVAGTAEKFRMFPESNIGEEYWNPLMWIGQMAQGLGEVPKDIQEGNYGKAALSVATPLTAGALAGLGSPTATQFAKNVFLPLGGLETDAISNAGRTILNRLNPRGLESVVTNPFEFIPQYLQSDRGRSLTTGTINRANRLLDPFLPPVLDPLPFSTRDIQDLRWRLHNNDRILNARERDLLNSYGIGDREFYRSQLPPPPREITIPDISSHSYGIDNREFYRNQLPPPPQEITIPDISSGYVSGSYNPDEDIVEWWRNFIQRNPNSPLVNMDPRIPRNQDISTGYVSGSYSPDLYITRDLSTTQPLGSIDLRRNTTSPVNVSVQKPKNVSGLTKEQAIQRASNKDKDAISKMSEEEFQNTVLKPTGEIVPYSQPKTVNDVVNLSAQEYADEFNSRLDLLNEIIAERNKSGIEYRVKGLDPSGNLVFYTPPGQSIPSGESTWVTRLNPGQWRGNVEDIANTNYVRSIPGIEMTNTMSSVFPNSRPIKGTGAYESINEYLKRLDLGRVKPGFNSQTDFSRGAWENFIKSGRAVGFFGNPSTIYGTMKSAAPYLGAGYLGYEGLKNTQPQTSPESGMQYGGVMTKKQLSKAQRGMSNNPPIGDNVVWDDSRGQFVDLDIIGSQRREAAARREAVNNFYRNIGETKKSFAKKYGTYQNWKDQNMPLDMLRARAVPMMYGGDYRADEGLIVGGGDPRRYPPGYVPPTSEPTRADSLLLLRNNQGVEKYFKNNPRYFSNHEFIPEWHTETINSIENRRGGLHNFLKARRDELNSPFNMNLAVGNVVEHSPETLTDTGLRAVPMSEYYKPIDKYRYFQKEIFNWDLDTRTPFPLYDTRIKPTKTYDYENQDPNDVLYGDRIQFYGYEPLAITPWDMLNPVQKVERLKKYGVSGSPYKTVEEGIKNIFPAKSTSTTKPKVAPTTSSKLKVATATSSKPELGTIIDTNPIPSLQTRGVESIPYTIPSYQREPLPIEPIPADLIPPRMDQFYFGKNRRHERRRLAGKPYTGINQNLNPVPVPSGDLFLDNEERIGYYKGQPYIEETPNIDKRKLTKNNWTPRKQHGGMASYTQPTEEQFFTFGYLPNSPVGFYDMGGAIGLPGGANELPCLECGGSMQDGGATQYGGQFEDDMIYDYKKGGWIQKVTKSIKRRGTEGVCTGDKFGGPSCPPGSKRYNLAKTFRAMAKKQYGGMMDTSDQDDYISQYSAIFQNRLKQNALNNMSDEAAEELTPYAQYGFQMPYYYDESYNPFNYTQQKMYANRINDLKDKGNDALSNMYDAAYNLRANADPYVKSIQIKTGDDVNERFWNKPYNIPEMRSRKRSFEYGGFEDDYELPMAQKGVQGTGEKTDLERALENSSNRKLRSYSYLGRPLSSAQDAVSESAAAINAAAAQNTNTNTSTGTNKNTGFQYASGYKVPYSYYGNPPASNAGTSSGTTRTGSFDEWLAYQEWLKSQGQQPSQQQKEVTGANIFPMNFGRTRGNGYIPTIAYNPANTYLQDFDYRGRLFGQGPRRVRMKFRTYFDPVTGETKQLPIADQLRESYNQDVTKGDVSNLNKVTLREPKIPLLNPDNINSSYVNIPEGDDLYKSPVPAALEPKKEEAAKTQTTTQTPAKSAAEKVNNTKTVPPATKSSSTDNWRYESNLPPYTRIIPISYEYGGYPLQMYYDGGGNDMYGLLGRMNAKSLIDPMYAQQFIGEDELTNPLGINKDGVAYNKDGTRKKTPKNYEDWETDVKYGRGYQNEDLVNWGLAGVDTVSSLLRQREMKDLEQGFRRNTLADNVFMSASPANRIDSRGRYVQTGMGSGMMDPQNMTPIYEPGANYDFSNPYVAYGGSYAYGGAYQEGDEVELSQDEIDYIMANGGSITYID